MHVFHNIFPQKQQPAFAKIPKTKPNDLSKARFTIYSQHSIATRRHTSFNGLDARLDFFLPASTSSSLKNA